MTIQMSKQNIKDKLLGNMRFTCPEKYFWKDNILFSKKKEPNLFGSGFIEIENPITILWRGKPVEVV